LSVAVAEVLAWPRPCLRLLVRLVLLQLPLLLVAHLEHLWSRLLALLRLLAPSPSSPALARHSATRRICALNSLPR
jgi:hypothetical protein